MADKKNHIDLEEKAIVEGCINDDRHYQELLYKKYGAKMYNVCRSYASDRSQAMDFLQEGFIEVFKKIGNFRFEGSLEGWVRRVVVFRTIDALRKEKRYQEVINLQVDSAFVLPEEYEIEETKTKKEKLRELVNNLPGKAGLVLKLYVLEGLTHQEIADYLEISVGTSKSQLNRARTLLKETIGFE